MREIFLVRRFGKLETREKETIASKNVRVIWRRCTKVFKYIPAPMSGRNFADCLAYLPQSVNLHVGVYSRVNEPQISSFHVN